MTAEVRESGPRSSDDAGRGVRRWLYLFPRNAMIFLIELYRTWVSPLRLPTCRFEPTCSAYAVEALTTRGFVHGGALSILRLLKCGPWHKPGYDPVPERGFRHRAPVTDPVGPNAAGPNTAAETSYRIADCGVRASMEVRDS